ncbi:MAG: hypothetical protein M1815_000666 [Lichina confinis]|nr:MAG: hypothetical protein M1815_000666 [Lichina confinis]
MDSKPTIMLVSLVYLELNQDVSGHLLSALRSKATLLEVDSAERAIAVLSSTISLHGIILGDGELGGKHFHAGLRARIVDFAKAGGTVVLGCDFSSLIRPSDFNKFFDKAWKLPWRFGTYYRSDFFAGAALEGKLNDRPIPASYSQKAVAAKGVREEHKVYVPTTESWTQSRVFMSTPVEDLSESPVAFTQIGQGHLGYVGDVNSEVESTAVVLAMFGLS